MENPYLIGIVLFVGSISMTATADDNVTTVYFDSSSSSRPAAAQEENASCPLAVTIVRRMGDGLEEFVEPLLDCDRHPRPEALRQVSILARPRGLERPSEETLAAFDRASHPGLLAADVRELHPDLLDRLQRLSEALDGHPIEILSGYRPGAAASSRHHHGRALDLRVQGVERARVRDVAVGFERSGVGWYPNSIFVHLDVREESIYWVDESAPGEPARYVASAEPPASEPAEAPSGESTPSGAAATNVPPAAVSAAPAEPAQTPTDGDLDDIERETGLTLDGIRIEAL